MTISKEKLVSRYCTTNQVERKRSRSNIFLDDLRKRATRAQQRKQCRLEKDKGPMLVSFLLIISMKVLLQKLQDDGH